MFSLIVFNSHGMTTDFFFLNCSNKQQVLKPQHHHLMVLHRRTLLSLVYCNNSRQQADCLANIRHNSHLLVSVILPGDLVQLVVVVVVALADCLPNIRHNSHLLVLVILPVDLVQLVMEADYLDRHSSQ